VGVQWDMVEERGAMHKYVSVKASTPSSVHPTLSRCVCVSNEQ
jgi:hypothetical protein